MSLPQCSSRLLRQFGTTALSRAESRFNLGGLKTAGSNSSRPHKPRSPPKDWSSVPSARQPRALPRHGSKDQQPSSPLFRQQQQTGQRRHPEASHRSRQQQPPSRTSRQTPVASSSRSHPQPTPQTSQDSAEGGVVDSSSDLMGGLDEVTGSSDDRVPGKRSTRKKVSDQDKEGSKAYWKNVQKEKSAADAERAKKVHATKKRQQQPKQKQVAHSLEIPSLVTVSNLARLLNVKLGRLQYVMQNAGITDTRADRMLASEDSAMIALEFDIEPVFDDEKAFDIFPDPHASDPSSLPLRPPIVTIMGHVDHGKTTLLDKLRSTSVAAGEAGGITQHIGAFQVQRSALLGQTASSAHATGGTDTITFLDTPGHAAFKNMRSRGRGVTDIVVLVVAADDGVMAQTQEVVDLIKDGEGGVDPNLGVVVAVTKCDKPGADPLKAKEGLAAAGLTVEDLGGDVPSIEVSAHTGQGMPDLLENITTISEIRDLRAEQDGIRAEGRVIESRVEKGRGNVATVLVLRGQLKVGAQVVAGLTRCKVRQMTPPTGKAIKVALPGQPVEITGWRDLPQAGDEVLEANSDDEAKRAMEARQRRHEQLEMFSDVEAINEKRRIEAEQEAVQRAAQEAQEKAGKNILLGERAPKPAASEPEFKELPLIIRADVSGTAEAVAGVLEGIGNNEARVKIVSSEVGDVTESDLTLAKSAGATIVGFNVRCPRSIQTQAQSSGISVLLETVIYRLVDTVTQQVISLLPVMVQSRIVGEASVLQVFNITVKGRQTKPIAGCRIGNGTVSRASKVRVVRDKEVLWQGHLDTLKQGKTDATSVGKGNECGMAFEGFKDFQAGDQVLAIEEYEVARSL